MSSSPSTDSRISVEPYTISLDSRILVDNYNELHSILGSEDDCKVGDYLEETNFCVSGFSTPINPICFKQIPRRVSPKRFEYLTSERQLKIDIAKKCCLSECLAKIGMRSLKQVRLWYFSLNGEDQDTFLANRLQLVQEISNHGKVSFEYYLNLSCKCCRKAFKIALGLGNMRLDRIQCRYLSEDTFAKDEFEQVTRKGLVGKHAVNWMQNYFRLHCEVMPTTGRLHLPDIYTQDELFNIYKDEMESQGERYIHYSQFTRLWRLKFDNVMIPRKVRMGVCSLCATIKGMIKGAKSNDEKDKYKRILKEHQDSHARERMKAMHHRDKALKFPGRYMCLMVDGMDQKKTCLPHFTRLPKDINEECLVQMHLVGCLAYRRVVKPYVFLTYPNVHNDPNLTISIIQRVLQSTETPLPQVLYLQLDNTTRENKNSTVFGYLSMLVHKGLFKKVKVNFLLVGHTHDHIDQMFSTFSKKLSRYDAFTLPALSNLIGEAYTPKPEVFHLTEVYDFKRYALALDSDLGKVFAQLHNISFNHMFMMIERWVETENVTLLFAKQYSSTTQWEPPGGCRFLLQMPIETIVHGAEQMPYKDKKIMTIDCDTQDKQRQLWMHSLEGKRKHIEHAKKYAGDQDVTWWDTFFLHQHKIIDYYLECNWPLTLPFTWTLGMHNSTSCSLHHEIPDELQRLIHPQQRDIYVGPRMTRESEARWHGNLQEIKVSTLIATLADGNELGHPFWIAKVLELIKDENQNRLLSLKVHWYYTTCHNAFTSKYTLEMMSSTTGKGAKRRKKNVRRITTLHLEDVDIILYDFTLTKLGHLRKSTIKMIKEKLQPETSQRRTRSTTQNPADVGLHLDEDNALINSSEEDESSYMSTRDTSGSDAEE